MGAKNYIKAIMELVRVKAYKDTTPLNLASLFGASLDNEGFAYVGSGEDDDPLIVGVTSTQLLTNSIQYDSLLTAYCTLTHCPLHAHCSLLTAP